VRKRRRTEKSHLAFDDSRQAEAAKAEAATKVPTKRKQSWNDASARQSGSDSGKQGEAGKRWPNPRKRSSRKVAGEERNGNRTVEFRAIARAKAGQPRKRKSIRTGTTLRRSKDCASDSKRRKTPEQSGRIERYDPGTSSRPQGWRQGLQSKAARFRQEPKQKTFGPSDGLASGGAGASGSDPAPQPNEWT